MKKSSHQKIRTIKKRNIRIHKKQNTMKSKQKIRTKTKTRSRNTKNTKKHYRNTKGGKSLKVDPTPENANNALLSSRDTNHDDNELLSKDDKSFNTNPYIRESHNCYTYFLNMKSQSAVDLCVKDYKNHNMCRRAQPGYVSGHKTLKKAIIAVL